ncbi:MAG: oligoribonuclease [Polyangiaceae bacterium]
MAKADRLVWMDLEMTGLDPWRCAIVEIATLVTDGDLTIVAEGPNLVVHQPDEVLAEMDDFVREMHTRSGLLDRIRASEVSLEDAETMTLAFLQAHVAERSAPLCGNSIWKDRQFVERYLPRVDAHLHYRNIDVSSFKEVLKRWYPGRYAPPEKKETHRALDDIRESIAELAYYRSSFLISAED